MTDPDVPLWRNRGFRRYLLGRFATNAGDGLYAVAVLWTVHRLTGSALLTGAASAVSLLPFLLQVLAGPVVVARRGRRPASRRRRSPLARERLGRVGATKGTVSGATLPFGSLLGGVVATVVGPTTTLALAAGGFGFAACYVLARGRLRALPPVGDTVPADYGVTNENKEN